MNEENEFLGFDPSQLSVFNTEENAKGTGDKFIYRTRPIDSISEDSVYRCKIKPVYNPFNVKQSVIEQQVYAMQDANGFFSVTSSLTNGDKSCPIFTAWKKCHFAKQKDGSFKTEQDRVLYNQALSVADGGKGLFDKRFARYILVQVLEDKNQPDLVNKFLFWKVPASVWEIIDKKMNPAKESGKAPLPIMDFLFGRAIDLEVTPGPGNKGEERWKRETKYTAELSDDVVSCVTQEGSPLLNDAEQEVLDNYVAQMKKVWKSTDVEQRNALIASINADPNTVALRPIYSKVIAAIKLESPNLVEHFGYKPWSEEMTARVQKWIDIVLEGNNPAAVGPVGGPLPGAFGVATSPASAAAPAVPTAPAAVASAPEDDLPF